MFYLLVDNWRPDYQQTTFLTEISNSASLSFKQFKKLLLEIFTKNSLSFVSDLSLFTSKQNGGAKLRSSVAQWLKSLTLIQGFNTGRVQRVISRHPIIHFKTGYRLCVSCHLNNYVPLNCIEKMRFLIVSYVNIELLRLNEEVTFHCYYVANQFQ